MRVRTTRARSGRADFGCSAAVLTGLAVLTAIAVGALAIFSLMPGNGGAAATFIRSQPGSVPWDHSHRLNVLLLGLGNGTPQGAADSLVIASYFPAERQGTLFSLPSNLWVTVPGYGQATISQAYADGGPGLALLTVESVTHVVIPYYAVVSHDALRQITDGLGGISLTLPGPVRLGSGAQARSISPGRQHLDGASAVQYAQSYAGQAEQIRRQQSVLLALGYQVLTPDGLFRLPGIIAAVGGQISTNFPFSQITSLAHQLSSVSLPHVTLSQLGTSNGTVSDYTAGGAQVLLPHWDRIKNLARQLLGDSSIYADGKVEVVNGSGVSGQAASLADWLRQATVHVSGIASANSFGYARTVVKVSGQANVRTALLARDVSALLQAPIVHGSPAGGHSEVLVVIGRDFQDPTQQ